MYWGDNFFNGFLLFLTFSKTQPLLSILISPWPWFDGSGQNTPLKQITILWEKANLYREYILKMYTKLYKNEIN